MRPSDSLPPSATAPVPLAGDLPRCRRVFCAPWADGTCARNVPCVGDGSPALRQTGMCRGEARASQVSGPSSSCVLWSNTPPDMRPSSPCDAGAIVAFAVFQHARHPGRVEVSGPQSHGPHVRMPPHRKPCLPRPAPGLLPAQAGSPLAGQVSHLLDDKQSFMEASHPPIPFDQPCLVALEFLYVL